MGLHYKSSQCKVESHLLQLQEMQIWSGVWQVEMYFTAHVKELPWCLHIVLDNLSVGKSDLRWP